jgi:dimethylargininase
MAIYEFTHAIIRKPARSVALGLREGGGPDPTFEGIADEHAAYAAALLKAGLAVTVVPGAEQFPDSVFIEDPALVLPEGAILLRPGAPSRAGEAALLEPVLREKFVELVVLDDGHAEGGDVLAAAEVVFIGLSKRTDTAGAHALARALARFGRRARIVQTPAGVLHFKSDCALIDEETVLTTSRLSQTGVFKGLREILAPEGEERAANALRVNEALFVGAGFPRTADRLDAAGYAVTPLATEQIGRLDAGLSCLSLRWRDDESVSTSAAS